MFSLCILVLSCEAAAQVRVPAEWEAHAATWMQWPGRWERAMRPAFADIIDVIQGYEPVHLLTSSQSEQAAAAQFLTAHGVPDTNITWHIIPVDNGWMRDNGPVYVTDGTKMWIQNWEIRRVGRELWCRYSRRERQHCSRSGGRIPRHVRRGSSGLHLGKGQSGVQRCGHAGAQLGLSGRSKSRDDPSRARDDLDGGLRTHPDHLGLRPCPGGRDHRPHRRHRPVHRQKHHRNRRFRLGIGNRRAPRRSVRIRGPEGGSYSLPR